MRYAPIRAASRTAFLRRVLRSSEPGLIVLAGAIGIGAGLAASIIGAAARGLQALLYGFSASERLSGLSHLSLLKLLILPFGGLVVGLVTRALRTQGRTAIDVVEANALHGGRIPIRDTLYVTLLTLLSNGFGASVGLEAAYAQAGGGGASWLGQWLRLRRADLRVMVGAGAGGAIAAAFGAPLTGAFYAFEIVIGTYSPAAIAPIAAASIAAAVTARTLGATPYLIAVRGGHAITTPDYFIFAGFGIAIAIFGIAIMWLVTGAEATAKRLPLPDWLRPAFGGLLLVPIAWASPQALSAGHGALHLSFAGQLALVPLVLILTTKSLASIISLGSGFRGGLFFASLLLGAILGQILCILWMLIPGAHPVDMTDAALVGMAALAVAVVGGPMTMALLVLEATHDFEMTATVLAAVLCASAFVRDRFGYSFSTWRLHLRGEVARSARDIGWMRSITAGMLMREAPPIASATDTVEHFRRQFPLGSTSRVILIDSAGRYAGILPTANAFDPSLDRDSQVIALSTLGDVTLKPSASICEVLHCFDEHETDDLAIVDGAGRPLGILTEKYARRRYASEADRALREAYGED